MSSESDSDKDGDSDSGPIRIRCPCGNNEPIDIPGVEGREGWVQCDGPNCDVWQHSICVGLTEDKSDMPENYFCEECKPEHHKRFHFGSGSDNRYDIAKERQEMHVMPRSRKEDQTQRKIKWLITEVDAIVEGHPQAVTVEWATLNGMQAEFQAAVSKARKASDMPVAPWSKDDFEDFVRFSIRIVLRHVPVSVLEQFRASIIKVRFGEAEDVAAELWSLRARLNDDFMTKMEAKSSELGKANVDLVRKYFNME
jgi:hypothetical protein